LVQVLVLPMAAARRHQEPSVILDKLYRFAYLHVENLAPSSPIQLLEIAVDAPLAERDAPFRGEIGGDARPFPHPAVQRDEARDLSLEPFHALGERIAQALDDLEQREVDIGQLAAEEIIAAARGEHALEVAEKFRHAIFPEIGGAPLGGRDLLLEGELAGACMMRIL